METKKYIPYFGLVFPLLAIISKQLDDFAYIGSSLLVFIISIYVLKTLDDSEFEKIFKFYALAYVMWAIGEFIWYYYSFIGLDPFPSIADAFYIGAYVPATMALAKLEKMDEHKEYRGYSGIIVLVLFALFYPILASTFAEGTLFNAVILTAYPVFDFVLLFFALPVMASSKGSKFGSLYLMLVVAGTIIGMGGDLLYAYGEAISSDFISYIADLLFMTDYAITSAGFMILIREFRK